MDKYEYREKTEQMLKCVEQKEYGKAMEIADTIEWRKVKNASMLCSVSEIYEQNEQYEKSRDVLFIAYDRTPGSRKIIYRLGILALKLGETSEAMDCYEEFVAVAPKDPNQYILYYKILKAQGAPLEQQIEALEEFKKGEYIEKWVYELAKLYHEAGMVKECLEECDDLILWFSEGKYVYQAMELKMQYKPLTPLQQEKYNQRFLEKSEAVSTVLPQEEAVEDENLSYDADETEAPQVQTPVERELQTPEDVRRLLAELEGEAPEQEIPDIQTAAVEEAAVTEAVEDTADAAELESFEAEDFEECFDDELEEELVELEAEEARAEEEVNAEDFIEAGAKEDFVGLELDEADFTEEEPGEIDMEEVRKLEFSEPETDKADVEEARQMDLTEIKFEEEVSEKEAENADAAVQPGMKVTGEAKPEMGDVIELQPEKEEFNPEDFEEVETGFQFSDFAEELERLQKETYPEKARKTEELEEIEEIEEIEAIEEIEEADDDDQFDLLNETVPMSRIELAKAAATGRTGKIPVDEITSALHSTGSVGQETGFIMQARYDLEAQSEVGIRAGLTEEQKKLFSYFVPVRGMSEQLVDVLEQDKQCTNRRGSSRTGNLLIIGAKGSGKTVLAVDVVKAIQKQRRLRQGKVAIVTGDSLNKKKIKEIIEKLYGGALIIEKAGRMNEKTVQRLNRAMERDTGELLIVLEEQRKPLDRLLSSNKEFRRKFTSRLEVPVFINDELVTFGQAYAKENGFKIDEVGILALYSRIDMLQREDHIVTVTDVKEVMDEAIERSQKGNVKNVMKRMLGKNTDDSDRVILSEKDFNI